VVYGGDILPIGLYWEKTGPLRPNASSNWSAQPCPEWKPKNATYADANGDGIVNQADINVVGLNWGKRHSFLPKIAHLAQPTAGEIGSTWQCVGDIEIISINLSGVELMSGVALEWRYPAGIADVIAIEPGKQFGSEALFFAHDDKQAGRLSLAMSLKGAALSLSGDCRVATIRMRTKSQAQKQCHIENASWLNISGEPFALAISLKTAAPLLPKTFQLWQNYPNPFLSGAKSRSAGNPATIIKYDLPEASHVVLRVLDVSGRAVRTLKSEMNEAGSYEAGWDGRDDNGRAAASGIYFFKIETGKFTAVRKGILMR
jgi:hypothetical protein